MFISCPLPTALTSIRSFSCPFKFDQIVRLAFQRRQPTGTPPFATLSAFQTLANWTTLRDATDSTKIVISPIFSGFVIPASEGLSVGGGDNSTFAGMPEYTGEAPVTVTGVFKNIPPAIKRDLDLLSQESVPGITGGTNLTAYPVNHLGNIFPVNPVAGDGTSTTIYTGIPIYNFRISSVGSEGFNSSNIHNFSFTLPANWADYLAAVKPSFDPLSEL